LKITFNGHELAPPVLLKHASGPVLETALPQEEFVAGDAQTLRFSRKDQPVKIWEIRLIDPHYSIADFLGYVQTKNPALKFSKAWWDSTRAQYILCCIGGVLFFGGIWPTVVRLLTGSEPERSKEGGEYDLDRFKGEPPKQGVEPKLSGELDTSALEDELAKGAKPRVAGQDSLPATAAPTTVLNSEPVKPIPVADEANDSAEYKGEYYPVVRPSGDKHERKKR
jgi:hypothetical protein